MIISESNRIGLGAAGKNKVDFSIIFIFENREKSVVESVNLGIIQLSPGRDRSRSVLHFKLVNFRSVSFLTKMLAGKSLFLRIMVYTEFRDKLSLVVSVVSLRCMSHDIAGKIDPDILNVIS